ncbi:phage portal protein [candidate division KSB1 bacterium]
MNFLERRAARRLIRRFLDRNSDPNPQTGLLDRRAMNRLNIGLKQRGIDDTQQFWNLGNGLADQGLSYERWDTGKSFSAYWGWISAFCDIIADNVASTPLKIYDRRSGEQIEDHPILELLNNVNSYSDGFELRRVTDIHLSLAGNAFWHLLRDSFGVPRELEWLRPDLFSEFIFRDGKVSGYRFRNRFSGRVNTIPAKDMIHFKLPNPTNPFWGMGTLQKAVYTYNEDLFMRQHSAATFENRGRPDLILTQTQMAVPPGDEELESFYERWEKRYGGQKRAGRPALLDPGMDIKVLSSTLQDLEFSRGRELTREDFAAIFGVPLSKRGLEKTPNRATAEVSDYTMAKDVVLPRLKLMETRLNSKPGGLTSHFDDRIALMYDNPVPRDREYWLKETEMLLRNYVIPVNEVRKELGKYPKPGFDVPWAPGVVLPLGSGFDEIEGGKGDG